MFSLFRRDDSSLGAPIGPLATGHATDSSGLQAGAIESSNADGSVPRSESRPAFAAERARRRTRRACRRESATAGIEFASHMPEATTGSRRARHNLVRSVANCGIICCEGDFPSRLPSQQPRRSIPTTPTYHRSRVACRE